VEQQTMMIQLMFAAALAVGAAQDPTPSIDGAFIQFDHDNKNWSPNTWQNVLQKMYDAKLMIVIVQYMEVRDNDQQATSESYLPVFKSDPDPTDEILKFADDPKHVGMKVLIGLRLDKRLMSSVFLNEPGKLRKELPDELSRNVDLAKRVACYYHLIDRKAFAGWYLPVEIANFKETAPLPEDRWVDQLRNFTTTLATECKALVPKPIAVSPYFNGTFDAISGKRPDWLVGPEDMGKNYARYLQGTGISIVMLQDGVGVANIPADRIAEYVGPFLTEVEVACGQNIELWLNVESFTQCCDNREPAKFKRLKTQLDLGKERAKQRKVVTFEFAHYFGVRKGDLFEENGLYTDYRSYLSNPSR
jgi:Domain of unknown function (DUF4434)